MNQVIQILKSKNFLIGLFSGVLMTWALFLREPFLTSKEDNGSYAYGQQMGKNLKNGFVEYDSRIVRMGMDHASRGQSKLEDKELLEGLTYLSEKSMPLRREALAKQPVVNLERSTDELGFLSTPFGFSYLISTWKDFQKNRDESRNPRQAQSYAAHELVSFNPQALGPQTIFEFSLNFYDGNQPGDPASTTPMDYKHQLQELPESLQMILSTMKANDTWLVKLKTLSQAPREFAWPQGFSEEMILEIKRLK